MTYTDTLRRMREGGSDLDAALAQLRGDGASMIDCVKAVTEGERIALGEAKVLVDASPVFADRRRGNERLRDEVVDVFKSLDRENPTDP
jgi:hypothetical protein